MARVKILLAGSAPKEVQLNRPGETLSSVVERAAGTNYPLDKVQSFSVNRGAVADPSRYTLSDGDVVTGTPKIIGG